MSVAPQHSVSAKDRFDSFAAPWVNDCCPARLSRASRCGKLPKPAEAVASVTGARVQLQRRKIGKFLRD
jgi:hypothetical protein